MPLVPLGVLGALLMKLGKPPVLGPLGALTGLLPLGVLGLLMPSTPAIAAYGENPNVFFSACMIPVRIGFMPPMPLSMPKVICSACVEGADMATAPIAM
uniref:Uncharacterized protein n=1 Tax=Globisporangium ultimum (strain ATCC 200006 / CBS 805.95 / DAOM BR144) TaxID=431595 RepID=K3X880_GLOUD